MAEYPEFIPKYQETLATIRERLNTWADPTINEREGDVFHDLTEPSAREFELSWDIANDIIAVGFLMHANGVYLDYKAAEYNVYRLDATKAEGTVIVTGSNGAVVPLGTVFSTEAIGDEEQPLRFVSTAEGIISGTTATVPVEAEFAGRAGNAGVAAITLIDSLVNGVTGVTNTDLLLGGTDIETDDALRTRALEAANEPQGAGTPSDYRRWVKSVAGVGSAAVFPRWSGVNTVKVSVLDPDSNPVSQSVLDEVQRLLTGNFKLLDPVDAPLTAFVAGAMTLTNVRYKITFTDGNGETKGSPATTAVSPVSQQINVTNIPIGPAGTTARRIYRSINGGDYLLRATLADNTTQTFNDNSPTQGTILMPQTNNTSELDGIAPPGADVTVVTPSVVTIEAGATISFHSGYSLDGTGATIALRGVIEASIRSYIDSLLPGDDVVFNKVEAQMFVTGVRDVSSTTVEGATGNVTISDTQVARSGVITLV